MLVVLVSCNYQADKQGETVDRKNYEKSLLEANKQAVLVEDRQIEDFIKRHNLEVQKTGTGLRFMIYEKGNGKMAEEGRIAEFEFTVRLITGDSIYSSDETGTKEFLIGRGGVEPGLEEGILLLREGDRAKFILPSHLAFGLLGDQDKIPPKATLIYDVKLLKIKDK
jgi:FKBP-type peptidyl-prolyl cis-trans isomerase